MAARPEPSVLSMETTTHRPLGPARIVALALITVAVAALAYMRFAPDAGPVSVPPGAHAGQLTLKPCTYATEHGGYRADCGTLVVPENRNDPRSRLIALPVTRIRSHAAHPGTPVFRLEGGPGLTNMAFAKASRFAATRDVVLVGYRGVDGSVRLACPEVVSAMRHEGDALSNASMKTRTDAFAACAKRLTASGVDLAGYTLPQRVDDLEAARRALGYRHIDLLSESAGTRTAMIYSWRHPASIERSVMIGANPPGHFLWRAGDTDAQIRRYAALCARDTACRGRTPDLAASLAWTSDHMPDHWWFLPIKHGNVRIASFMGLMNSTSAAAPLSAPLTLNAWVSAAQGDASALWLESLATDLLFPQAQLWGDVAAASRADARAAQRYFATSHARRASIMGDAATEFVWGGGRLLHAWPANGSEDQYTTVQTSQVPTLVISGDLDGATPAAGATRELMPHLPNGHQVVLRSVGHTDDFWSYQPPASTHLVDTFLSSGRVDDSRYTQPAVDFSPGVTQATIAKIVLGSLVGCAFLMLASLAWLVRRVRRRGAVGRRSGALVRSLHALVIGLGGWCLGALVALTILPSTPLDDEVLTGVSVGLPVGLAVFAAWMRSDWSVVTRAVGASAALAGALVGGWLGFNATTGIGSVLTAIAGAAAGSNLALIALDVAWDRSARDRFAERAAAPPRWGAEAGSPAA
jgi:pimeloyl-ACP methyl ester carboxylesterase